MYATGHLDVVAIRHNLSCRSMSPNHGETMRAQLRDCRRGAVMAGRVMVKDVFVTHPGSALGVSFRPSRRPATGVVPANAGTH